MQCNSKKFLRFHHLIHETIFNEIFGVQERCMAPCKEKDCCSPKNPECGCDQCSIDLERITAKAFSVTGGVSLFFSFTEVR